MLSTLVRARSARLLLAAVALAGTAACNDSTGPDDHDDHGAEIAAIRFTVTPQGGTAATYTLSETGTLTPNLLQLPVGTAAVRADFLDDDGTVITDEIHDDEFEVRFTNLPAGVSFARTGAFAGTFTGATAGTGTLRAALFHLEENHEDFGPFTLNVQVGG